VNRLLVFLFLVSCSVEEPVEPAPVSMVVIDGNSLATGSYNNMFTDSGYLVRNVAVGGQTLSMMISDCSDVDSVIEDNALLIVDEVTNELYFGSSPDTAVARLKRYCRDRMLRHPSLRIVVVTPTPRANRGTPPDFESRRQSALAMIRNDRTICDFVANAGDDAAIGMDGSQFDTRLYYDSVHHTLLGYHIRGSLIWEASHLVRYLR